MSRRLLIKWSEVRILYGAPIYKDVRYKFSLRLYLTSFFKILFGMRRVKVKEIVKKYEKPLYEYLYQITQNKELSEYVMMRTIEKAIRTINKIPDNTSVYAWFLQIANNVLLQQTGKKEWLTMNTNVVTSQNLSKEEQQEIEKLKEYKKKLQKRNKIFALVVTVVFVLLLLFAIAYLPKKAILEAVCFQIEGIQNTYTVSLWQTEMTTASSEEFVYQEMEDIREKIKSCLTNPIYVISLPVREDTYLQQSCYVVQFPNDAKQEQELWIEKETMLPIRNIDNNQERTYIIQKKN